MAHTKDVIFTENAVKDFIKQIRQNPEMVSWVREATQEEILLHNDTAVNKIPGKGITIFFADGNKKCIAVGSDIKIPSFDSVLSDTNIKDGTITLTVDGENLSIPLKGIQDNNGVDVGVHGERTLLNKSAIYSYIDKILNGDSNNNRGFIPGTYTVAAEATFSTTEQNTLREDLITVKVDLQPVFSSNKLVNSLELSSALSEKRIYWGSLETQAANIQSRLSEIQTVNQMIDEKNAYYDSRINYIRQLGESLCGIHHKNFSDEYAVVSNDGFINFESETDLVRYVNEAEQDEESISNKKISLEEKQNAFSQNNEQISTHQQSIEALNQQLLDPDISLTEVQRQNLLNSIAVLEEQIEILQLENNQLQEDINLLTNDIASLEQGLIIQYCHIINGYTAQKSPKINTENLNQQLEQTNNEIAYRNTNNIINKIQTLILKVDQSNTKNWTVKESSTSNITASLTASKVYGAVFNDYAEYRSTVAAAPGQVVIEQGDGTMRPSTKRLELGGNIVSDTFGFAIGETEYARTPIAVCGRVLAYTDADTDTFTPGAAVCSGPNGTVSMMTREEIREWPDAIIGYVSEIPTYEVWGTEQVHVNGRIWIKVK